MKRMFLSRRCGRILDLIFLASLAWFCAVADAQTTDQGREQTNASPTVNRWRRSMLLFGAAAAADGVASWQRPESNPVLRNARGEFSGRGVAIKAGITGGWFVVQWAVTRRRPELARVFRRVNEGAAIATGASAAINWAHRPGGAR